MSNDLETISGRLEQNFQRIFNDNNILLKPHVINTGVSSYFSSSESMLFNFVILNLKPDYVILFDGTNDFLLWAEYDIPHLDFMNNNYQSYQAEFFDNYNSFFTLSGIASAITNELSNYSASIHFLNKALTRQKRLVEIVTSKLSDDEELFKKTVDKYT